MMKDGRTHLAHKAEAPTKEYHSNQVLVDLAALDLRTYIAEPDRGLCARGKGRHRPAEGAL